MRPIRHLDNLTEPGPRVIRVCKTSCQVTRYVGWLILCLAVYVLILVAYTPTEF